MQRSFLNPRLKCCSSECKTAVGLVMVIVSLVLLDLRLVALTPQLMTSSRDMWRNHGIAAFRVKDTSAHPPAFRLDSAAWNFWLTYRRAVGTSCIWSLAESGRRSLVCATRLVCDKRPHSVVDIGLIKRGNYRRRSSGLEPCIRWSNITCRIVRSQRTCDF